MSHIAGSQQHCSADETGARDRSDVTFNPHNEPSIAYNINN